MGQRRKLIRPDLVNTNEVRAINVGTCAVEMSIAAPYIGNLVDPYGPGVVAADARAFQDYARRNANEDDTVQYLGASLHLIGSATKDARTLEFDVFFAPNAIFDPRAQFESVEFGKPSTDWPITIVANDKVDVEFEWNDYVFFRTDTVPDAALHFEAWAFADEHGNQDGVITTDELEKVRVSRSDDSNGDPLAPGRFAVSTVDSYSRGFSGMLDAYISGQAHFGWTRTR